MFIRHKRLVGFIAGKYFHQTDLVDEVVQKTFVRAYFELKNFRGDREKSFSSWIGRITSNVCVDLYRTEKRRAENFDFEISEDEWKFLFSDNLPLEKNFEEGIINRDLAEKILAKLNVEDRFVLQMLDSEELSVGEIAEIIGWSKAKVKIRAFRARRILRKIVKKFL